MIETERLILRPPVDGDRASVAAIGADPEVGRWLGGVRDRAASDLLVDRCLEHLERFGFGIGVIERKANYTLQDGKVFDTISRTTPTGGKDLTFLQQLLSGGTSGANIAKSILGQGNNTP